MAYEAHTLRKRRMRSNSCVMDENTSPPAQKQKKITLRRSSRIHSAAAIADKEALKPHMPSLRPRHKVPDNVLMSPKLSEDTPVSPSMSSVASLNYEDSLNGIRLRREGPKSFSVQNLPLMELDEMERYRIWSEKCMPVEASGLGIACNVVQYKARKPGRSPIHSNQSQQKGNMAVLGLEPEGASPAPQSTRQVMRFSGLCFVINWNPVFNSRALGPNRAAIIVLSWQLRCFCVTMSAQRHRDLLGQSETLMNSTTVWLKGNIRIGCDLPIGSEGFVLEQQKCADQHGISVEPPPRTIRKLPSLSLSYSTSIEILDPGCILARHFHSFFLSEIARHSNKIRMHGPGRVAPGARKTQMGTRRRRRRSQIAAPRPVTGDNIAVPSVEIRSRLDLMRLANAESDSEEIVSTHAYEQRHKRLEALEKESRAAVVRSGPELWVVCDNPECRKWRLLAPGTILRDAEPFYCGGSRSIDADACQELDDWIVQCLGKTLARQCAMQSVTTIEGLLENRGALQTLEKFGLYYERDSQAILPYD